MKDDYILDTYNFLLHSVCTIARCAHDKPFMDVQHFNGIVWCKHICRTVNGGQSSILQFHAEGSGEVFIQ